jgi:hypothetical protein
MTEKEILDSRNQRCNQVCSYYDPCRYCPYRKCDPAPPFYPYYPWYPQPYYPYYPYWYATGDDVGSCTFTAAEPKIAPTPAHHTD